MTEDSVPGAGFPTRARIAIARACLSTEVAAGAMGPVDLSGSDIDSPASRSCGPIPIERGRSVER